MSEKESSSELSSDEKDRQQRVIEEVVLKHQIFEAVAEEMEKIVKSQGRDLKDVKIIPIHKYDMDPSLEDVGADVMFQKAMPHIAESTTGSILAITAKYQAPGISEEAYIPVSFQGKTYDSAAQQRATSPEDPNKEGRKRKSTLGNRLESVELSARGETCPICPVCGSTCVPCSSEEQDHTSADVPTKKRRRGRRKRVR